MKPQGGIVAILVCTVLLPAQPPPPSVGYPGGGSVGIPVPTRRGKTGPQQSSGRAKEPLLMFQGVLKSRTSPKLVLAPGDGRELDFTCTKDTKYFREGREIAAESVKAGAQVIIEARQDQEGFLFAVHVRVEKAAPPAESAPADESTPTEKATTRAPAPASPDPDDPGPPALRRGQPGRVKRAQQEALRQGVEEAPPAPVPPPPEEDQIILKARQVSEGFTESLPNYIVQQITTRYFSESHKPEWKALDILSTEVVYETGKESYRNVRINNKPVRKPLEEVSGTVSWGEFGTTLVDLLSPATNAQFRRRGASNTSGQPAWWYDFSVELPNSHWQTRYGSHSLRPAYKGSVWLDRTSLRVLRIEMQARNIPEEYPLDAVEWVVDYGVVRIGSNPYLVPVHAENLACWRGTSRCARNSTDYRNYRRFTADATVYTTETNINFGGEAPPPAAPPKKP